MHNKTEREGNTHHVAVVFLAMENEGFRDDHEEDTSQSQGDHQVDMNGNTVAAQTSESECAHNCIKAG